MESVSDISTESVIILPVQRKNSAGKFRKPCQNHSLRKSRVEHGSSEKTGIEHESLPGDNNTSVSLQLLRRGSESSHSRTRERASVIREVQAMGFNSDTILNALAEFELRGSGPLQGLTVESLLQLMFDMQYNNDDLFKYIPESDVTFSNVAQQTDFSDLDEDTTERQKDCIICMEEEAVMAFIPCGHVKTCAPCAELVFLCPICRKRIRNRMRIYL